MMQLRKFIALWLAALLAAALLTTVSTPADAEYAEDASTGQWGVDGGRVHDIVRVGDRIYFGGDFSRVEGPAGQTPNRPNIAAFDANTGAFISSFSPSVNGKINTIEPSSDESMLYLGGEFTTVNGSSSVGIVAIDPLTGATVPTFDVEINADRLVEDIEVIGDSVYLVGTFNTVNEVNNPRMAKVDATTGAVDVAFRPRPSGRVLDMAPSPSGDRLYVVGTFTEIDNTPRNHAVAIDPITGDLDTSFTAISENAARAIDATDTRVVVAHRFRNFVSVYDTAGNELNLIEGEGDFQDVEIVGDRAIIGSHSIEFGGLSSEKLHAVNLSDGSISTTLDSPVRGWPGVLSLYASGPDLWIGGEIFRVGTTRVVNVARIGTDPAETGPSTPAGLTASTSGAGVNLSWSASTDDTGIAGYRVLRSGNQVGFATGSSFTDAGAVAGVGYVYHVEAVDTDRNVSLRSNTAAVNGAGDTSPPTVPGPVAISDLATTSLTVNWIASSDNVAVDRYEVLRDGALVGTTTAPATSFADTGLSPATTYTYEVRAIDAADNASALSTPANATTLAGPDTTDPTAPTALSISGLSDTGATLSWAASTDNVAVTSYDIVRDGVVVDSVAAPATSFVDVGLAPSTTYTYVVRAFDAAGNVSADSASVDATTLPAADTEPPSTPLGIAVLPLADDTLRVTWTSSSDNVGVDRYEVVRNGTVVAEVAAPGRLYVDDLLAPATTFTYFVRAVDAADNRSGNSPATSATTPDGPGGPDTTAPDGTITSPSQGSTAASNPVLFTGSATDDVGVAAATIAVRNITSGDPNEGLWLQSDLVSFGPYQEIDALLSSPGAPSTDWELSATLPDGVYTAIMRAEDTSANTDPSSAVVNFFVSTGAVDTTLPVADFATPTNNEALTGTTHFFSGTATDDTAVANVEIVIRDVVTGLYLRADGTFGTFQRLATTLDSPGATATGWSASYDLAAGSYIARVITTDSSGNSNDPRPRIQFTVS